MNRLFNLSGLTDPQRAFMEKRKIEYSKVRGKLVGKSRADSKPKKCLSCGVDTTKFCNSHTIPASFLRNIAIEGKVYTTNKIIDTPLLDTDEGVNKSGTFNVICRDCDSKIFQQYENSANYENIPTDEMIAQIAMKNHLRNIGKRRLELALYENIKELYSFDTGFLDQMLGVSDLDLNEYLRDFKRAQKVLEKDWKNEYYLFFYEKLNYVVPLAFQGEVALHFDLSGNLINNVYNTSKKYVIQTIHISVFPFKDSSVVMLFVDKNNKRYRTFYQQFKKLGSKEKLAAINFIIFSYTEDVFMSKGVHDISLKNKNLRKIAGLTSIQAGSDIGDSKALRNSFNISKMNTIPNFLLQEFEILN